MVTRRKFLAGSAAFLPVAGMSSRAQAILPVPDDLLERVQQMADTIQTKTRLGSATILLEPESSYGLTPDETYAKEQFELYQEYWDLMRRDLPVDNQEMQQNGERRKEHEVRYWSAVADRHYQALLELSNDPEREVISSLGRSGEEIHRRRELAEIANRDAYHMIMRRVSPGNASKYELTGGGRHAEYFALGPGYEAGGDVLKLAYGNTVLFNDTNGRFTHFDGYNAQVSLNTKGTHIWGQMAGEYAYPEPHNEFSDKRALEFTRVMFPLAEIFLEKALNQRRGQLS